MPNREEIHSCVEKFLAGAPAATTGTITSATLDTQGFGSAHFNLHWGSTAPAPTSTTVNESDDGSTWAAAPAAAVIDDGGAHAVSTTRRIAYIGSKRYAQVVVVLSASSILAITGHMGYAAQRETANPA